MASAETMEKAIGRLEPLLEAQRKEGEMAVIILATVKGDIHDIGKNLVALMLKNYGYEVIDLGKDVEAEKIIDTALEKDEACGRARERAEGARQNYYRGRGGDAELRG